MDLLSIIGFILAIVFVIFGIIFVMPTPGQEAVFSELFKFTNIFSFIDYPSMAITIGGCIATLMISFPWRTFTKIIPHMKIILFPRKYNPTKEIDRVVELAREARKRGLLALEDALNVNDDSYLRNGIMMVVDAVDPEKVKTLLEEELDFLDSRHGQDRAFYDKGATFAPAFGMIGTLIGLILMLKQMDDPSQLGSGMSTALITTFYGSMMCNVIFLPISAKLKVRHEEEYLCKLIICEGIQAIQAGENPRFISEKLYRLLPSSEAAKNPNAFKSGDFDDSKDKKSKKGA